MLHDNMIRKYVGNEDLVSIQHGLSPMTTADISQLLLMEVALDVDNTPLDDDNDNNGTATVTRSSRAAERFLADFPLARIVVVIDTHCPESGFLLSGLGYNPTRDGLILQQDTLLLP